jgi:hypothetical protein
MLEADDEIKEAKRRHQRRALVQRLHCISSPRSSEIVEIKFATMQIGKEAMFELQQSKSTIGEPFTVVTD